MLVGPVVAGALLTIKRLCKLEDSFSCSLAAVKLKSFVVKSFDSKLLSVWTLLKAFSFCSKNSETSLGISIDISIAIDSKVF